MQINNLTPYAATGMIDALKGAADLIEEASEQVIYFGFCKPGTLATSEAAWSIMKISIGGDPTLTSFKWAEGKCCYHLTWDGRAGYTYSLKNF